MHMVLMTFAARSWLEQWERERHWLFLSSFPYTTTTWNSNLDLTWLISQFLKKNTYLAYCRWLVVCERIFSLLFLFFSLGLDHFWGFQHITITSSNLQPLLNACLPCWSNPGATPLSLCSWRCFCRSVACETTCWQLGQWHSVSCVLYHVSQLSNEPFDY